MATLDRKELRRLVRQDLLRFGLLLVFAAILIGTAGVIGGLAASYFGAELAMIGASLLFGILLLLFGDRWMEPQIRRG